MEMGLHLEEREGVQGEPMSPSDEPDVIPGTEPHPKKPDLRSNGETGARPE